MTENKQQNTLAGLISTVLVTAFFVWTGYMVFFKTDKATYSDDDIRQNEISAFESIQLVSKAQSEYIKQDRDKDGTLEYSMFVTHLWRTIGPNNEKIQLNLIPKELAFAIKRTQACNGYYFVHQFKKTSATGEEVDMDLKKEWGVLMIPAVPGAERISFFTNQTGIVYANYSPTMTNIPEDPESDKAWEPITSVQDLLLLQKAISNAAQYKYSSALNVVAKRVSDS